MLFVEQENWKFQLYTPELNRWIAQSRAGKYFMTYHSSRLRKKKLPRKFQSFSLFKIFFGRQFFLAWFNRAACFRTFFGIVSNSTASRWFSGDVARDRLREKPITSSHEHKHEKIDKINSTRFSVLSNPPRLLSLPRTRFTRNSFHQTNICVYVNQNENLESLRPSKDVTRNRVFPV